MYVCMSTNIYIYIYICTHGVKYRWGGKSDGILVDVRSGILCVGQSEFFLVYTSGGLPSGNLTIAMNMAHW